jgi:uncharacterized UPF0160 family protein
MLIITHNSIFHADEVFAIASLIKWSIKKNYSFVTEGIAKGSESEDYNWTDICRTRDAAIIAEAQNSNSYVIDCGGIYDVSNLNFDHHQDINLPASNIMVWDHLLEQGKIGSELHKAMFPLMVGISNFDTNKDNTNILWSNYNANHKFRNLSNIISGFNRNPSDEDMQNKQFKKAVEFALSVLDNEEYSAIERINAEATYSSREILENNVAVFNEFCPIWKTKEEHMFAILPNPQGWSLNTANSSTNPLPEIEHKDLIFAHKGRFIAVFKTKEAAIEVAELLLK